MTIYNPELASQKVYKVLIIEDSVADYELYHLFFKKDQVYTYKIEYAETGVEGLESFLTHSPDLILMDFSLPDMDGLELMAAIQKLKKSPPAPIIMMTGQGNEAIALQAMKNNVYDYLVKGNLDFQSFIKVIYEAITLINSQTITVHDQEVKILLIDDSEVDLEVYRKFIQKDQDYIFNIDTATTGEEALAILEDNYFDIIITDYQLLGINGIDMINQYKKFSTSKDSCAILITAYSNEKLVVDALKAGFSDYLIKQDITPNKIRNVIKSNLQKYRLENQLNYLQFQRNIILKSSIKIRSSLELNNIIQTSVIELKKYLHCDRTIVYQLDDLGTGTVIGEVVNSPFSSLIDFTWKDTFFQNIENRNQYIYNNRKQVINDIETAEIDPCHYELLKGLQIKSVAAFPIIINTLSSPLWGLVIIHYCHRVHVWQQREINFLDEMILQISIAIQQGLLVKELRQERDKANAATQAKSTFLANMSHEIRTPMNGILGMAEMLSLSDLSQEQQDSINIILSSGKNLLNIINDILDLSKLEAGKLSLEIREFILKDIIQEIIDLLCAKLLEKRLKICLEMADLPVRYLGDSDHLRQILLNLIGNAIKFTQQGDITVIIKKYHSSSHLQENEIEIYFAVKDTGIGISLQGQEQLFQPFSQVEKTTTRNFGGTGLGLSICKNLVELMGGEIGANSIIDQGSTFWFTTKLKVLNPLPEKSSSDQKTPYNHRQENSINRINILVAEDNIINQKVIKNQLKKIGYNCHIVENGEAVIEQLQEKAYDLILMDCQMPILDGYDATRRIRQNHHTKDILIIGLSAFAMKEDKQKCIDVGMNDYLSKPCSISELAATLQKWVGSDTIDTSKT